MWRISFTVVALVAVVASHPQYGPVHEEQSVGGTHQATQVDAGYPTCELGSDCVPLNICKNGVIDTSGAGSLDLRGKPEQIAEKLGYTICQFTGGAINVCCKIPDYVGEQVVSGGGYDGSIVSGGGIVSGVAGGALVQGGAAGGYDGAVGGQGAVGGHGGAVGGHGGAVGGHGGAVGGHAGAAGVQGIAVTGGVVSAGIHSGAPVSGPPYPACGAGLFCVEEITCNLYTGFIGERIPLYEGQPFIEYKHCTSPSLSVGVCCQDPSRNPGGDGGYVDTSIGGAGHVGAVGGGFVDGTGVGGAGHVGGGFVDGSGVGGAGHVGGGFVDGSGVGGAGHVGGGFVDGSGVGGAGHVGGGFVDGSGIGGAGHVGGVGQVHDASQVGVGGAGGGYVDASGVGGSGHVAGVGGAGHVGAVGQVHDASHVGVGGAGGGYVDTSGGVSGSISSQCGVYEECVLREYCNKGIIISDGSGFIDLRGKYTYNKCVDPEYPGSDAVCCRPDTAPPVLDTCSNYEVCTDYQNCSPEGFVSDIGYSPRYSTGNECYKTSKKTSALTGVCCKPSCPSDSVCIPETLCFGDIQTNAGVFSPYSPGGSWAQCSMIGQKEAGVCCQNPLPSEPTPTKCGVSQYAQTNSIKTRYKTPTITKLEADFGEFPWQAIVFFSNYTFRCGASIITDKHLLTAAHCVRDHYPADFRIRVGEWQVNTFTEPYPYHDYEVAKITYHPDYKRGAEHNNLVVLELSSPMTLAYNVNTVCLPADSYSFAPGTRCFVSGWGKDSFVGDYQHILKKVDVPLVEHSYCQTLLRKTRLGRYFRLHNSFLCAGGEKGKDACTGDGGGPLVCLDENNQYVLAGVTSWGIGCGVQDVPGVYADVGKFVPWILNTIDGVSGNQYGK